MDCDCGGRDDAARVPQSESMHDAIRVQSAPCLVQAISGWARAAAVAALARGTAIPPEAPLRRPWALLAFSASAFSASPSAAGRPAEVPRPLDWDRPSSRLAWRNRRGYGLPAPEQLRAGTC